MSNLKGVQYETKRLSSHRINPTAATIQRFGS